MGCENKTGNGVSRRDILKLGGLALASTGVTITGLDVWLSDQKNLTETGVNREVYEILNKVPKMEFDAGGNLLYADTRGRLNKVALLPTEHDMRLGNSEARRMKEVLGMIVHYDGAPPRRIFGQKRIASSTVHGLNNPINFPEGALTPSVHFCIDHSPINPEGNDGFGILQSQVPSGDADHPNKGQHVQVGINLQTKAPDVNHLKTQKLMQECGIQSRLLEATRENKDFNSVALGFEQIGTKYSYNFPDNFPSRQQTANVLGLSLVVMHQHRFGPWELLGHHEVQEKGDPGKHFMATLRYLTGVCAVLGLADEGLIFGREAAVDYFHKLTEYSRKSMGKEEYGKWDRIYGMDRMTAYLEKKNSSPMGFPMARTK